MPPRLFFPHSDVRQQSMSAANTTCDRLAPSILTNTIGYRPRCGSLKRVRDATRALTGITDEPALDKHRGTLGLDQNRKTSEADTAIFHPALTSKLTMNRRSQLPAGRSCIKGLGTSHHCIPGSVEVNADEYCIPIPVCDRCAT